MATKDGFQPDSSPIFLSEHAEEAGHPDIGKAWERADISSRILKASVWAVAVTAIGIAILSVTDPVALVANVAATWADNPAPQPEADASAPAIQTVASTQDSTAGAQDLQSTSSNAPVREEVAAVSEPTSQNQTANQNQAETAEPQAESLLKEFEAWAAARKATRAEAAPVPAAPTQVAQDAPAHVRPAKKQRRARSVQNARAEIRSQRNHRARIREEQNAPVPTAPVPDARAPEQSGQNSQMPSFLQGFGLR